ncbi:dienelactone hydrolase family protein [Candidatus Woesearchaeota archaeon]|nr:dienelactone hydrolase family protein [Candidatus Woesearchaeota archaeon]
MIRKIILLMFAFLLIACAPQEDTMHDSMTDGNNLADTHPISDTMGCQPEEVAIGGTCTVHYDGNSAIFGDIDLDSIEIEDAPNGYLVKPAGEGPFPGVIMIHEWWGLNENVKSMAHQLAAQGYVVYAIDLYDGNVADTADQAMKLVTVAREDQNATTQKLVDAAEYLKGRDDVGKIGSMGWCFGGGQSLQLALSGEKLDATVIYYGSLTDDKDELQKINWPVLGVFGSEDQGIPPESVMAFESALDDLSIKNDITIYEGANHAFANPSGDRFNEEATKDAWNKTLEFFDDNLK